MFLIDKILKLTRQLYPTGRAWKLPFDGFFESLHRALGQSEVRAYEDSISFLDSLLPDTDRFTSDDATDWERHLGMVTNLATPLADRKLAIKTKMAAPGINPARGHYLYLQTQLRNAGFDVYVHENLFALYPSGYENQAPNSHYGNTNFVTLRHGMINHGAAQHGKFYNNQVVNSIYQSVDNNFNLGGSLAATFFIGGQTLGTYASVPASREIEFRQQILAIKQVQAVGLLFINYTP